MIGQRDDIAGGDGKRSERGPWLGGGSAQATFFA
jgi:hypothetical protein